VSSAGTVTRGGSQPGEVGPGRRLLLLSESPGLAAVLTRLLDRRDRLTRTGWSREASNQAGLAETDLVVLDVPRAGRAAAFQQLRRRYQGPVVVLVERGDDGRGLPADQARTLLARPFSTDDLRVALGLPAPPPAKPGRGTPGGSPEGAGRRPAAIRPAPSPGPTASAAAAESAASASTAAAAAPEPGATEAPAALTGKAATLTAPPAGTGGVVPMFPAAGDERAGRRPGVEADGKAAAQQAPPRPAAQPAWTPPEPPRRSRLALLRAELVHNWRAKRAVRIFAFAALAAVAFGVAFALAAQGRCGPGCDALTGIISPASTLPEVGSSGGSPTTVRRLPPSTTTPTPGSGVRGVPGAVFGSTTSTTRRTTTTRGSSPTSRTTTPPSRSTTTTESTTTTTESTTTTTIVTP
jgi:hypothetical protein